MPSRKKGSPRENAHYPWLDDAGNQSIMRSIRARAATPAIGSPYRVKRPGRIRDKYFMVSKRTARPIGPERSKQGNPSDRKR
jgi:hypothetical protein